MLPIALFTGYLFLFFWLIGKLDFFRTGKISIALFRTAFLLKVAAGCAMALIYTYYYTERKDADIFRYFDDSKVIFDTFFFNILDFARIFFGIKSEDPYLYYYYDQMVCWDAYHTNIVIRFNVLARFFSMGNYYVHIVLISFLSLLGLTGIIRVLGSEFADKVKITALLILFTPSLVFWTSGVLKEGILISALGLFFFLFHKTITQQQQSWKSSLALLGLLFIIATGKGFVFAILAPLLAAWVLSRKFQSYPFIFFGILLSCLLGIILISQGLGFDLPALIAGKQQEFIRLSKEAGAGSYLHTFVLSPDYSSIIKNTPLALFNALARPSVFDSYSLLTFAAAAENIILALLICIFLLYPSLKGIKNNLFCFSISFSLLLLTAIGLTTPVMGAAVRYRVIALPFLIISLLILTDTDKLKKHTLLKKIL